MYTYHFYAKILAIINLQNHSAMNNKINSIHQLRGVAALLVVLFHFRIYINGVYSPENLGEILFGSGAFGVDLFFIISGFIISLSTKKQTSLSVFAIRRFFRIYPAFILTFIVGALTVYSANPIEALLRSMFFIHQDYSQDAPGFGWNILGPAWTLSYEIYFYAIFSLSMVISQKYRTLISSLILISPMILIQVIYTGEISLAGNASPAISTDHIAYGFIRFISSPIMVEFVFGMALYELYRKSNIEISKSAATSIMLACIAIFIALYLRRSAIGFGMSGFGFWSLILIIGLLAYEKNFELRQFKTLNFFGDISFSLYISHYLIMNSLEFYKPMLWANSSGFTKLSFTLLLCIIIASLMHNIIEKPFINIGKTIERLIKNRSPKLVSDN